MFLNVLSLVLVFFCKNSYGEVCFNTSVFGCECRQFTEPKTHIPIKIADCSDRKLEDIPDSIEEDLNFIDFSVNLIQRLDSTQNPLNSDYLQELILRNNNITHIDVNFFNNVKNLRKLDISNNFIASLDNADIFKQVTLLHHLDISFNNLNKLPDNIFAPLNKLTELDLSYNYMGDFLTQGKSVLVQKLGLNRNITQLSLNGLNLKDLPNSYFDDLLNLKRLSLADNGFTEIPSLPYTSEYLDLSGNKLTYISAKYLNYHSLKVLKLNRMATLTDIHHYAFYNLFALEKLFITDCPNLKQFSELAFDVPSKDIDHHPKYLSLARNGLTSLNESYKYFFKKMHHVDLTHNPWDCDCNIIWLQDISDELYKPYDLNCNYPSHLMHKNILYLEPSDLKECFPTIYGKKSHRVLIVVLSLSCVCLCGLVFYLLRYPIHTFSTKHRIGPHSPYNLASTTEQI